MSLRCAECHAAITAPADLAATTMRCGYCGREQPVPDLEQRRALLLEERRLAHAAEARREAEARHARDAEAAARDRAEDRREAKRSRRGMRLMSLLAMLIAPVIIAITVFDLPARLGFGDAGEGRLAQVITLRTASGCTVLAPVRAEYASGNVSRIVTSDGACLRVLAAGGDGHRSLGLRLYDADGEQVAEAKDTSDPQLTYCPPKAGPLRYELRPSPASKGRLSHAALACPKQAEAPAPAAQPGRAR